MGDDKVCDLESDCMCFLNLSEPPECLLSPAHDADYRNDALLASIPPLDTHHHMIVVCDYDLSSLARLPILKR